MFGLFKSTKEAPVFTQDELDRLKAAIQSAEQFTSGEIRLVIERRTNGYDVMDRAAMIFSKLKMKHTAERNAVLIYMAYGERQYAILGDKGIHEKVSQDFWNSLKQEMYAHFSQGKLCDGLCEAILACGKSLKAHFPHQADDKNELPDEVVML
jgi:uncharacterized membrane protein